MLKLRAFILLGLCVAVPAQAGLFSDDEARKQVEQVGARVLTLEDTAKQQTQSFLDLQGQLEELKSDLRKLRGQNEELAHGLQDAEKREKDFYVDLDTRLRRFESGDTGVVNAATTSNDPSDPVPENRALEAAYAWVKAGNNANALKAFQDFLKKYPDSVHVPNALYWLANAQSGLKDDKSAIATYDKLLNDFPSAPKAADAMLNMAISQTNIKQTVAAQKTLKQVITKYPNTAAADKARRLLAASK
ncbi:MAG: tol-pal system protein YbgF [Gallionella sp.]